MALPCFTCLLSLNSQYKPLLGEPETGLQGQSASRRKSATHARHGVHTETVRETLSGAYKFRTSQPWQGFLDSHSLLSNQLSCKHDQRSHVQ